jgi:hypothetical protein
LSRNTTVYRTAGGAKKLLVSSAAHCATPPSKELSVGAKIGDEAHLCAATRKSGSMTLQAYVVLWRHGRGQSSSLVGGVAGTISPKQAITLAEAQDKPMR